MENKVNFTQTDKHTTVTNFLLLYIHIVTFK